MAGTQSLAGRNEAVQKPKTLVPAGRLRVACGSSVAAPQLLPITATVGNLSPSLRVKGSEVLVLGIIPGPRKRDITPFIEVLLMREVFVIAE